MWQIWNLLYRHWMAYKIPWVVIRKSFSIEVIFTKWKSTQKVMLEYYDKIIVMVTSWLLKGDRFQQD